MQQAADFLAESDVLAAVLATLPEASWARPTQFKGWSVNDIMVHLHFWNQMAHDTLTAPQQFQDMAKIMAPAVAAHAMRPVENAAITARGRDLFAQWQGLYRQMATQWAGVDPKLRLPWMGPDMSARSSMTARQMETWAHGQAVFDLLGQTRPESDRIRNIVVLGVNTFAWSHQVQGLPVPAHMPQLQLQAPSGAIWQFGAPESGDLVSGSAVEFAQVVTQTRALGDTALQLHGAVAQTWLAQAQCFAGPPEAPPPPGARFAQKPPKSH